jgi:protein-tyrosine phosphatase
MAISMGTLNIPMERASGTSVEVMRELGIDLASHRSQGVAMGILARADVVYVMERKHEQKLLADQPALRGKVRLLGALDDPANPEIPDPIGKDRAFYLAVRDRIVACVDLALDQIAPAS